MKIQLYIHSYISYCYNFILYCQFLSCLICFSWIRFRCLKHWLKGINKGKTDIFIENLPAGPDNINLAPDGSFWIALIQVTLVLYPLWLVLLIIYINTKRKYNEGKKKNWECSCVKFFKEKFYTSCGPTQVKGLIFLVAHRGHPIHKKLHAYDSEFTQKRIHESTVSNFVTNFMVSSELETIKRTLFFLVFRV